MARVDRATLDSLVEQHYLSVQKHPTSDLLIYNYTPRCQYERYWTPETLMCRGLIVRSDGTIVARPFNKFFNYEEHVQLNQPVPLEPFKVTEKLDGSLGILYFADDQLPYIATRGSFVSQQAQKANAILQAKYKEFPFTPFYLSL